MVFHKSEVVVIDGGMEWGEEEEEGREREREAVCSCEHGEESARRKKKVIWTASSSSLLSLSFPTLYGGAAESLQGACLYYPANNDSSNTEVLNLWVATPKMGRGAFPNGLD